jgi:DNA-binding XRE family transcriptional regulator
MTQEAVATSLGFERSSMTNIEAGTQRAPLHTLLELWGVLGVDWSAMHNMLAPPGAAGGGK